MKLTIFCNGDECGVFERNNAVVSVKDGFLSYYAQNTDRQNTLGNYNLNGFSFEITDSINVNFTEAELVVISKLLGYVGGNKAAYSAGNKIQEALGRDMKESDYASVKFYQQHTYNFGKCVEMKQIEDNSTIEIRIEEKVNE